MNRYMKEGEKKTLLVLAAGMGSRYGGLKQIDPVGPGGETIIDYSVYDAMRAGFSKLVFVIRRDIEDAFRESIGSRFEKSIAVEYVFQELDKLPKGFQCPPLRKKPWGTGHAILMAADKVHEPFAVINGDDFYGRESFQLLADHIDSGSADYAMVGFELKNTLSDFGSVARGICRVTPDGFMVSVTEITGIDRDAAGARYTHAVGKVQYLTGAETVSMNMWGFTPALFEHLSFRMVSFLQARGMEEKSEFFIPTVVNELVDEQIVRLRMLRTSSSWFGVTYREDRQKVTASLLQLIEKGDYPERLWV